MAMAAGIDLVTTNSVIDALEGRGSHGDPEHRGVAHDAVRWRRSPTTASAEPAVDKKGHKTVLVFDLGGGTFDVSILDVDDGVVEARATCADTHFGGDDFDRRLVDHLADQIQREQGIDLRTDPQALQPHFEAAAPGISRHPRPWRRKQ